MFKHSRNGPVEIGRDHEQKPLHAARLRRTTPSRYRSPSAPRTTDGACLSAQALKGESQALATATVTDPISGQARQCQPLAEDRHTPQKTAEIYDGHPESVTSKSTHEVFPVMTDPSGLLRPVISHQVRWACKSPVFATPPTDGWQADPKIRPFGDRLT